MRLFWNQTREEMVNENIQNTVSSITNGDFSDEEIAKICTTITNRSLSYLKERRLSLSQELESNIESIKLLENE